MCVQEESPNVEAISAKAGVEDLDRQIQRQSSSAIQRLVRMPLVRAFCGVLSIFYVAIAVLSTVFVIQSQLRDGVEVSGIITQTVALLVLGWLIAMQARIALYGELTRSSKSAPA